MRKKGSEKKLYYVRLPDDIVVGGKTYEENEDYYKENLDYIKNLAIREGYIHARSKKEALTKFLFRKDKKTGKSNKGLIFFIRYLEEGIDNYVVEVKRKRDREQSSEQLELW